MAQNDTCDTCRWFVRFKDSQEKGWCKHAPPVVFVVDGVKESTCAVTDSRSFCAQHERRLA